MSEFTDEQIDRYSRHIILPEVGGKGQKKLLESKVFLVGAGGLGSPAAFYLAAAGIGKIGISDNDDVDFSNLQRQILHSTKDVGRPKVQSAKETLEALNPDIEVVPYTERLNSENIIDIIKDYDVILDGSDNFPTRYLVNDAVLCLVNLYHMVLSSGLMVRQLQFCRGKVLAIAVSMSHHHHRT